MTSLVRTLLLAAALLSSGALQIAAAMGDDACCAGEAEDGDAPASHCPSGIACACCPTRGAVEVAPHAVAPAASPGVAISVVAAEPSLGAPATDIFQPPRA